MFSRLSLGTHPPKDSTLLLSELLKLYCVINAFGWPAFVFCGSAQANLNLVSQSHSAVKL